MPEEKLQRVKTRAARLAGRLLFAAGIVAIAVLAAPLVIFLVKLWWWSLLAAWGWKL
jgi:hypothetical protein